MGLTIRLPGWNVSVRLKHSGVKNFITWALKFCLKVVRLPLKSGGGPEDPHAWPGWRAWVRKRGRAGEKDFCDIHARQITRHPREYHTEPHSAGLIKKNHPGGREKIGEKFRDPAPRGRDQGSGQTVVLNYFDE